MFNDMMLAIVNRDSPYIGSNTIATSTPPGRDYQSVAITHDDFDDLPAPEAQKIGGGNEIRDGTARVARYSNDHSAAVTKDDVIVKLLPEKIGECSLGRDGMCVNSKVLAIIAQNIDNNNNGVGGHDDATIMERAKQQTGCQSQKCVVQKMADRLGHKLANYALKTAFKLAGPTNNQLLNDLQVDGVMYQYMAVHPTFYAYNFNMIGYADFSFRKGRVRDEPDSLATTNIADIYNRGFRTAGCIINSDHYQGPGKHWMALFVDMRDTAKPWTVEFFNSSGNSPVSEWVNWMVKTRIALSCINNTAGPSIERVTSIRHQQSRTECGMYSLFYVYARICDVPISYFREVPIPDQLMFEFRQHLFDGGRGIVDGKFDFTKYRKEVNITWE